MLPTIQDLEERHDEVHIKDVIKGAKYYLVRGGFVDPVVYVGGRHDSRNSRVGSLFFSQPGRTPERSIGSISMRRSAWDRVGYRLFSSERRPVVVAVRSRIVMQLEIEEE